MPRLKNLGAWEKFPESVPNTLDLSAKSGCLKFEDLAVFRIVFSRINLVKKGGA